MALYIGRKRFCPTLALYRGFWAINVHGFAGTTIFCDGSSHYIGSSENTTFRITEPGIYLVIGTRNGITKLQTVILTNNSDYFITVGMYIGMQEIEYLESTDTQYIDTGFSPNSNTRVVADVMVTAYVSENPTYYSTLFCARTSSSTNIYGEFICSQNAPNGTRSDYGTQQIYRTGSVDYLLKRVTVDKNKNVTTYSYNGSVVSTTTANVQTFETPYSLYIFKINSGGTTAGYSRTRVYSFKIYDNGTLIRDYIPVLDDTLHPAMYDKVTQQMYYNAGTGDFIAGTSTEYEELEYIESTGTQYIDTGFVPTSNTKIIAKAKSLNHIMGCRGADASSNAISLRYISTYYAADFNNSNYSTYRAQYTAATTTVVTIEASKQSRKIYDINGSVVAQNNTVCSDTFNPTNSIWLFGVNGITDLGTSTIYSAQIYENGTLVRDFIPVRRISTDEICMYDKITGLFFSNNGTGSFIAGPVHHDYIPLAYIETNGTQYIDTEIYGTNNTSYSITARATSLPASGTGRILFGSRESSTSRNISSMIDTDSGINDFGDYTINRQSASVNLTNKIKYTNSKDYRSVIDLDTGDTYENTSMYTSNFTTPLTLRIAQKTEGYNTAHYNFVGKIYDCDMYESGVQTRKFRPVLRTSDGAIGLYDEINNMFFGNAGTGNFIGGPEIVELPDGYRQVDYLEGSGTQYINTGFTVTNNTKIKAKVYRDSLSGIRIAGYRGTSGTSDVVLGFWENENRFATTWNTAVTSNYTTNQKFTFETSKNLVAIYNEDGSVADSAVPQSPSLTSTGEIYLFNINSSSSSPFTGKIYYCKIWDNDELVRNFIPSLDNNNIPCMYDSVTQTPFYNIGTGEFTYGEI